MAVKKTSKKTVTKKEKYNVLSIIAFICAFFIPLVGLILAIVALATIKDDEEGKTFAVAGLVISIVFMLLIATIFIVLFNVILFASNISEITAETSQVISDCQDSNCSENFTNQVRIEVIRNDNILATNGTIYSTTI